MSNRLIILLLVNLLTFNLGVIALIHKSRHAEQPTPIVNVEPQYTPVQPEPEKPPINYDVSDPVPAYKDYNGTWAQLQEWNEKCPELVDVGTYGKSSRGADLHWIKIENERLDSQRPVVLITAALHGNEPLSSSTTMGYIGTILDKYGDDERITKLVDERIIYFVPVVSPDSYPHSRHVDGVDPNRNFPGPRSPNRQSVPPVAALQKLFKQIRPNAVISGHTWGRVYLYPYGDQTQRCPNDDDYQRIMSEMGRRSNYRVQRACQMYNRPIYGTEVDWYYRNGAMAIVMEFGTHQRVPSQSDINTEFQRTFDAVLWYIEEAAEVEVRNTAEQWRDDWRAAA